MINVEGVSKRYSIGASGAAYFTLRDALTASFRAPLRRLRQGRGSPSSNTVWALKDVSFEVRHGEVVGLIGRNGAGKSTLLKVLSRITEPTEGRVVLYGRIGSLLEVGTGFHPELTGRENVFLNGAILGMSRAEVARKFDEIVAFSEVQRFIDTPVKFYSSGMYLRLAFAVAAHLEPDILIVDEVLAVGDAAFQLKCMNKMQDLRGDGRTILFVSHSMQAVTRLCQRAIYLVDGCIAADGPAHAVASAYLTSHLDLAGEQVWDDAERAPGNGIVRLRAVRVRDEGGAIADAVDIRKPVGVEMEYEVLAPGHVLVPNLHFYNEEGILAFVTADPDPEWRQRKRPAGVFVSTAQVPANLLSEGTFTVGAALSTMEPVRVHFFEQEAVAFQVIDSLEGDSARGDYAGPMPGVLRPLLAWKTEYAGQIARSGRSV